MSRTVELGHRHRLWPSIEPDGQSRADEKIKDVEASIHLP